jgi:hypothetical protein
LIPALSPTQSTTESLPTSSTRLEVVEDTLKGFNLTHLNEFEGKYPSLDFTPEIKTENPNLFNPEEVSNTTDAQLPTAEMETLSQMVFFILFCMVAYIMHKILIRVYTEAVKELERASFFEREMPYTVFLSLGLSRPWQGIPAYLVFQKEYQKEGISRSSRTFELEGRNLEQLEPSPSPIL